MRETLKCGKKCMGKPFSKLCIVFISHKFQEKTRESKVYCLGY